MIVQNYYGEVLVLANHSSGSINVVLNIHFTSEISINISGNIGPKITASLTMQSLTMMIVQIDYGEFWCSYWLTTHQGP